MTDITSTTFGLLLEFLYTGKLALNADRVWNVLTVATQLQLGDAAQLCRKYIDTYMDIDAKTAEYREVRQQCAWLLVATTLGCVWHDGDR